MKIFTYLIIIFFIVTTLYSNETNEDQIKVAYVYNFLKNMVSENVENINQKEKKKNIFDLTAIKWRCFVKEETFPRWTARLWRLFTTNR